MAQDHTRSNEQLRSVAAKQNMTLPSNMNAAQQAAYDKLKTLSGAEFDRAYVAAMLKDHEEDVKAFQKEAKDGKDEQVKSFAAQTLPTLEAHLEQIKSTSAKL
jgi:putative membrane protein